MRSLIPRPTLVTHSTVARPHRTLPNIRSVMATAHTPICCGTSPRRLWVFDFDWTVVDENSDTWIHRCAPGGSLPPAVRNSYVPPDWVGYMNHVLGFLAEQGVTAGDVRAELEDIPWTPGMRELLESIADSPATPDGRDPSASTAAASVMAPETEVGLSARTGGDDIAPTAPAGGFADAPRASAGRVGAGSPAPVEGAAGPRPHAAGTGGDAATAAEGGKSTSVPAVRFQRPQHAVILSDANSLFIPWILDGGASGVGAPGAKDGGQQPPPAPEAAAPAAAARAGVAAGSAPGKGCGTAGQSGGRRPLSGAFLRILTNPAAVDPATGAIAVSPHHGEAHGSAAPPHTCPRCHPNLCKREALRRLLDEQAARGVSYTQVVYVGDGRNDLCPCLALRSGDAVLPRVGFALHKLLEPLAVKAAAAAVGAASAAAAPISTTAADAVIDAASQPGGGAHPAGRRGDDQVYGTVEGSGSGGGVAGGADGPQGGQGDGEEVLRATCVPWVDAYDIMAWVRQQDHLAAVEDGGSGEDLATRARSLAL